MGWTELVWICGVQLSCKIWVKYQQAVIYQLSTSVFGVVQLSMFLMFAWFFKLKILKKRRDSFEARPSLCFIPLSTPPLLVSTAPFIHCAPPAPITTESPAEPHHIHYVRLRGPMQTHTHTHAVRKSACRGKHCMLKAIRVGMTSQFPPLSPHY